MGKVIEFYCDHCGKKLDQTVWLLIMRCHHIIHGPKTGLDEYTVLGYCTKDVRGRLFREKKEIKRQLCKGCIQDIIEKAR